MNFYIRKSSECAESLMMLGLRAKGRFINISSVLFVQVSDKLDLSA